MKERLVEILAVLLGYIYIYIIGCVYIQFISILYHFSGSSEKGTFSESCTFSTVQV